MPLKEKNRKEIRKRKKRKRKEIRKRIEVLLFEYVEIF